jgi:hypothetical protein
MYWHSYQVSILVHITYQVNPDYTKDGNEPRIIKESHFWVSNNKEHDTMFVQKCFKMHWKWLADGGVQPRQHWVFSDGCAA